MVSNLNSDKTEIYKYDLAKNEVIENCSLMKITMYQAPLYLEIGIGSSIILAMKVKKNEIIPVSNYYKKAT